MTRTLALKKHGSLVQALKSKNYAIQKTRNIQQELFFYLETY
jgi:hypothetical protein